MYKCLKLHQGIIWYSNNWSYAENMVRQGRNKIPPSRAHISCPTFCLFLSPLFFWLISTLFPFPSHKKHLYIGYIYNDNEEMAHKGRGYLNMLVTLYVLNRKTAVTEPEILWNLGETQRHTKKVCGGAPALALLCYCSAIVAEPAEPPTR